MMPIDPAQIPDRLMSPAADAGQPPSVRKLEAPPVAAQRPVLYLWLLERRGATELDHAAGFVVVAENGPKARELASIYRTDIPGVLPDPAWLDPELTRCMPLLMPGLWTPQVIMRDFRAG